MPDNEKNQINEVADDVKESIDATDGQNGNPATETGNDSQPVQEKNTKPGLETLQKNKSWILPAAIIAIVLAIFASSMLSVSQLWLKITNPVSAFVYKDDMNIIMPLVSKPSQVGEFHYGPIGPKHHNNITYYKLCKDNDLDPQRVLELSQYNPNAFVGIWLKTFYHNNMFIGMSSFRNFRSVENINTAHILGENHINYVAFIYDAGNNGKLANDKWFYYARHSDAPSILLYTYSYLINIPAKIIQQLNAISYIGTKNGHEAPFSWAVLGDIIINIVDLLFEVALALVNFIPAFIIALVCHPIDSLCSILPMVYMGIVTTFNAVWDLVWGIIQLPYHVLFVWK